MKRNVFNKVSKKGIALALCFSLCLSAMSGMVYAAEENTRKETVQKEVSYEVSDVTVSGDAVEVAYTAADDCTVLVALFNETGRLMYASAKKEVSAGVGVLQMSFEKEIPESFLVKAFLLDSEEYYPLAEEYVDDSYLEKEGASATDDALETKRLTSNVPSDILEILYSLEEGAAYEVTDENTDGMEWGDIIVSHRDNSIDKKYFFVVVKDKDAENFLDSSNLLFIAQGITDKKGRVGFYCYAEGVFEFGNDDMFIPNPQTGTEFGDLNEDGIVELGEAKRVLEAALGIVTLNEREGQLANRDRKEGITLTDANLVLKASLGIE